MIRQALAGACLVASVGACAAAPADPVETGVSAELGPAPDVREGRTAESARVTFAPERVALSGGESAPVEAARTVDGELVVPEDVQRVGWWDGSSAVGDPFGSTVVAGHVDSATEGLGYFARLLAIEPGEEVTVTGDGHARTYRVTSVEAVTKEALATTSDAFEQTGPHRLVLITCTGDFVPGRGYDGNLVVVAEPVGDQ